MKPDVRRLLVRSGCYITDRFPSREVNHQLQLYYLPKLSYIYSDRILYCAYLFFSCPPLFSLPCLRGRYSSPIVLAERSLAERSITPIPLSSRVRIALQPHHPSPAHSLPLSNDDTSPSSAPHQSLSPPSPPLTRFEFGDTAGTYLHSYSPSYLFPLKPPIPTVDHILPR